MTTEPVNKRRGEVPFPEAGEGAFLRFDIDSLERLESAFGEDYLNVLVKGLSKVNIKIYQTVIATCLKNSSSADIPYGLSFEELEGRVLDALYMTIHGRTFAEQKEHELDLMVERMGKMEENPHLATLLSSKPATTQDTEQG